MAAPKVTQSKVTPGPSTPPGSLTVTLAALEYQSGHAAARIRRSQMTSAGALMTMSLWANRSARSGSASAGQWMWADRGAAIRPAVSGLQAPGARAGLVTGSLLPAAGGLLHGEADRGAELHGAADRAEALVGDLQGL